YLFADDWEVTIGARLYEFEDKVSGGYGLPLYDTIYLGEPQDSIFIDIADNQTDDSGALFKVNLSRNFSDDVLGYVTISEGYRIGGLNAVPECTPEQLVSGNQELCATEDEILIEADTTTNYEVGVHSTLADGRLALNAAVYYVDWEDIQVDDTTINGSLPITSNGGKARSKGVEFVADWRINPNWRFTGSFSWNNAELAESSMSILGDDLTGPLLTPSGSRLPGSPEIQGSVSLLHTHTLNNGWDLNVRYGASYMGDIANSIGAEQFASVAPWGGEIIPSYTLHSLTVGVQSDRWTASLFVDNLTDEYAITGTRVSRRLLEANRGAINGLPLRSYGYYIGRPRAAGVSFTYDF
ncbi:MAG: TonB-dependent receptor, partial [Gammaproteobacteria bacterium]